jgi:hypothetical protein
MTEERSTPSKGVGTDDTTEYSASKAPETRREAEEEQSTGDTRLMPGGRHRAGADIGMQAMHRASVPSEAGKG